MNKTTSIVKAVTRAVEFDSDYYWLYLVPELQGGHLREEGQAAAARRDWCRMIMCRDHGRTWQVGIVMM